MVIFLYYLYIFVKQLYIFIYTFLLNNCVIFKQKCIDYIEK